MNGVSPNKPMKCITKKFTAVIEAAVKKEMEQYEVESQLLALDRKVEEFGEESNNRIEEVDSNVSDLDSRVDDIDSTVSDLSDKIDNIESADYASEDYIDDRINTVESELSDKMTELVAEAIDERKIEIAKEQVESIVKEQVKAVIKETVTKDFILALLATK